MSGIVGEQYSDADNLSWKYSIHVAVYGDVGFWFMIELSYLNNRGAKSLRELGMELGGIGGDGVLQTHKRIQAALLKDKTLAKKVHAVRQKIESQ